MPAADAAAGARATVTQAPGGQVATDQIDVRDGSAWRWIFLGTVTLARGKCFQTLRPTRLPARLLPANPFGL